MLNSIKVTLNYILTAIMGVILYSTRSTEEIITPFRALISAVYSFYILIIIVNLCTTWISRNNNEMEIEKETT